MEGSRDWKGTVLSIELWLIGMVLILPILMFSSERKYLAVGLIAVVAAACLVGAVYVRESHFRRQTAIAMTALGLFGLCGTAILAPIFAGAKVASTRARCISDIKQGGLALQIYAGDNDDKLPPGGHWRDRAEEMGMPDEMNCAEANAPWSYGFNDWLSAKSLAAVSDSSTTVLLFETESFSKNAAGGKDWFVPRHGGFGNLAFIDGQSRFLKSPTEKGSNWQPELTILK